MTMLRRRGPYMNLGVLVGHSAVRTAVMGDDASVRKAPTAAEIAEMKRLVAEAMDQGAIGGGNGGKFMSDLRCHARSAARLFGSGVDGPHVLAASGRIGVQADAERGRGAVARRARAGIDQAADKAGFPAFG